MTQKTVQKQKKKEKEIEEVIEKVKAILRQLRFNTFLRYREAGKEILASGYKKGKWYDEDREKALNAWQISQRTFSDIVQLGEMSDNEFSSVTANFPSYYAWSKRHTIDKVRKRQELIDRLREGTLQLDCPEGKYDVIVVDPPWPVGEKYDPEHWRGTSPYPEMDIEEIKALTLPANENSILWLWTTNRFIHEAFHILETWGFEPKSILTWVKHAFGLGIWLRGQTEHCIMATKGQPIIDLHDQATVIFAKRKEHSRKPDVFYKLVESLCFGKKLDYFSREVREGWDTFGTNEFSQDSQDAN